jgi:hypothetical protein
MNAPPDIIANDEVHGRILVVEVKDTIKDVDQAYFMERLRGYARGLGRHEVVYYLLVDRDVMRFFEERGPNVRKILDLNTIKTLENYMTHKPSARFSEGFLAGLTQAWLRDLAIKWKNETPEGSESISPDLMELLHAANIQVS